MDKRARAGPRLSLSAVLFCRFVDHAADCLSARSLLTLNTDLAKLAGEMRGAAPDYFLNVPALLERMRKAVDEQLWKTGGIARAIYTPRQSRMDAQAGRAVASSSTAIWLRLGTMRCFPTIRKKMIGDESESADLRLRAAESRKPNSISGCSEFPCCRSTDSPKPPQSAPWTIRATSNPDAWARHQRHRNEARRK